MKGLRPLSSLVAQWQPASRSVEIGDPVGLVAAAWLDAVGAEIGRRTRPGRVRDGTLTVLTTASAWSHQLTFLQSAIVANLQQRCPGARIRRLRFIVASGKSKALLDGAAAASRTHALPASAALAQPRAPSDPAPADLPALLARVRLRQEVLNRRRYQAGWRRCAGCASWFQPRVGGAERCQVCAAQSRRRADAAIERALHDAPWLCADALPGCARDPGAYDRVRRRLLTAWEAQVRLAAHRLRRDELEGADRIPAWSYLMLLTLLPQAEIGFAAISDGLNVRWARALLPHAARPALEAKIPRFTKDWRR
ncbi:MAG: DUF721 domain-containing protein [Candidatus Eremiobacteraeota bacterium]|nr:DUF721 domain-containing protein [Candidatus Eremiobacteraeota bacterium]